MRLVAICLAAVSLLFVQSVHSEAKPAICNKLERQLANSGSGNSSNKFAKAADAQVRQLNIAKGQLRANGCSGGFLSGGSNTGACVRLRTTVAKMEANLSNLRSKAGGGVSSTTGRSRILASLEANGCNANDVRVTKVVAKKPAPVVRKQEAGFVTLLFGGKRVERRLPEPMERLSPGRVLSEKPFASSSKIRVTNGSRGSEDFEVGNYRTVCVRTCDGYYFPVSYSSSKSKFTLDAKLCQQMCPGTEVQLYYHQVPSSNYQDVPEHESEDMVSVKGNAYSDLPTAFKYRHEGLGVTEGCSCRAAQPVTEAAFDSPQGKSGKSKWVPHPAVKPVALLDEETRLNLIGKLDSEAIRGLTGMAGNSVALSARPNVRVVGPSFLPAQEQAEAAQVPDQTTIR